MDNAELRVEELDLYEILDIEYTDSIADIRKAYRKKALSCHPDKNPDNKNAAIEFHRLSKILEILTDAAAKSAYDKVLKGRQEAKLRHRELDAKRRKLKEDLEARERLASKSKQSNLSQLQVEIERLRKEGSKLVQEEIQRVLNELNTPSTTSRSHNASKCRLKVSWNPQNPVTYSEEMLTMFLSKYGDIEALVMSKKKGGVALVEFKSEGAASLAHDCEIGRLENPLQFEWTDGRKPHKRPASSLIRDTDFESVAASDARRAAERRRIIEAMKAEDSS